MSRYTVHIEENPENPSGSASFEYGTYANIKDAYRTVLKAESLYPNAAVWVIDGVDESIVHREDLVPPDVPADNDSDISYVSPFDDEYFPNDPLLDAEEFRRECEHN